MTLSAAISPALMTVKPVVVTPKPTTPATTTPIRMTPAASTNVGPTSVTTVMRPAVAVQAATQADIAPATSPAQQSAAIATATVMRPAPAIQTAAPAATTTQVTLTPRPQATAAPMVAQPAPNRIDPMATNTVFSTSGIPIVQQPTQPPLTTVNPILIKPSAPVQTQTPAQQSSTIATATQAAQAAAAPPAAPQTVSLTPAQVKAVQAALNTGVASQVKTGASTNTNTGIVGPTAQQQPALSDLQRARNALVAWLNDAMVYATMDPDARLAAKNAILTNPDSSVVAKTIAALVSASSPQKANDQGTAVIIIPDDVFSGYLGAFTLAKRLLSLPESVNSPSAKTITNSIPALQALINLIDLALAGQALPTDIPDALKDDGAFYTKWWFWTIVGAIGIGGAAYVAHKRHH